VWNNNGDKVVLRRADGSLKDTCSYSGTGSVKTARKRSDIGAGRRRRSQSLDHDHPRWMRLEARWATQVVRDRPMQYIAQAR
jgi:hypothetical protein